MKKYIAIGLILTGLGLGFSASSFAATNKSFKADAQALSIPQGTILKLELVEPVSTQIGNKHDTFLAKLKDDKIVSGKMALPAGSLVRGMISNIVPPKRLSKSAIIYLSFDQISTPVGREIPMSAGLYNYAEVTVDGGIYKNGNYGYAVKRNWANTKKLFNTMIEWGKGTGDNMQYAAVPVAAVGGVFGGAGYCVGMDIADLFRKGNEVNLPQGMEFEVLLLKPLDIPIY